MCKFVDGRGILPTHPLKVWRRRDVSKILGFCWHHTAGGDDPMATARYHVGANHTSDDGMPGIAYTFYVTKEGEVWWCNDLDMRTWSQGGGKTHPDVDGDGDVDAEDGLNAANSRFMGIVFGGNFDSQYNPSGEEPTPVQIHAGLCLIGHLTGEAPQVGWPADLLGVVSHLNMGDVFPHADFGKVACPGRTLTDLGHALQASRGVTVRRTDAEWQQGLVGRGYDLGAYGPNKDGVDGHWGNSSRAALIDFQISNGLEGNGHKDASTQALLFGRSSS